MSEHALPIDPIQRRKARRTILLIGAISVLPLLAALYFRFVSPPPAAHTVGALLAPTPFPLAGLRTLEGLPLPADLLDGHWLMLQRAPAACDDPCRQALYLTRQVRMAQGKHMDRLARLWLLADEGVPDPELLAQHPDLLPVRAAAALPPLEADATYLIDRRGFLVFRYPPDVDPGAFIKELGKIVKF